jgi:glyoxylase-like metal-dependent hydrolase (beta-lactamase superfamily II)
VIAEQLAGFSDSVLPVYNAGLVDLVADDHVVTEDVRLMPSPGHTPHHVSVMIESRGQSAVLRPPGRSSSSGSPIRTR